MKSTLAVADRLWARVLKTPDCWLWLGSTDSNGYGTIGIGSRSDGSRRTVSTHRLAYELQHGPIPVGQHVLHTCDVRNCVRGDHLYLGNQKKNAADRERRGRGWQQKRRHCPKGHPYSAANTRLTPTGKRVCKRCDYSRPRRERKDRT